MITIEVWDITGNRRDLVELPEDEPVNRILVKLAELMNLPSRHPDGNLIVYKFHHASAGQLRDEQTLAGAGVGDGDVLRIYAEITAG
ncbi:MAG: EsaB/YukD family protein [Blastocatellia bacterium]|nr:EsaB/YukD family protein [Blastocatellia bacterium]